MQSCRVDSGLAEGSGRSTAAAAGRAPGERVVASPLAKSMAAGIDIAAVGLGSGPNGRIIAKDIEATLASGGLPLASVAADIELDVQARGGRCSHAGEA